MVKSQIQWKVRLFPILYSYTPVPFSRSNCYQHFLICPFRNGLCLWGKNIYICIYAHHPLLKKKRKEHMLYILFRILLFSLEKVNFGNCSILAHTLLAHVHCYIPLFYQFPFGHLGWNTFFNNRNCWFKVWYYMISSHSSKEIFISLSSTTTTWGLWRRKKGFSPLRDA